MVSDVHGACWIADEARGFEEMGEEFCSLETEKLLREAEFALRVEDSLREANEVLQAALDKAVARLRGGRDA